MRYLPGAAALVSALCLLAAMDFNPLARVVWIAAGVGLLWLLLPPHLYTWWAHVGLAALAGLAATAILQDGALLWAAAALWAGLVAWDLAALAEAGTVADIRAPAALVRGRLGWLAAMLVVTVAMALLTTRVSFTLTLPWALALGLTLVVLLARVVRRAVGPTG